MAGPWEDYASSSVSPPQGDEPWRDYASNPSSDHSQTALEALTGVNGPRYQLWPERLVRSVVGGAVDAVKLPGDVMQGKQAIDYNDPEFMDRLTGLATLTAPISPAARAGEGFMGAVKTQAAPAPTQAALDTAAATGYDKARNLGVVLPTQGLSEMSDRVAQTLYDKHGITPEDAPATFRTLDRLKIAPDGATVTIPNLDALRKNFNNTAGNFNNPTDQLAASVAKSHLSDYVASLTDQDAIRGPASQVGSLTKEANGNYAAARRSEQIAEALHNAELQAGSSNSGRNLDNATRQKFRSILTSDKNSAGYTPDELAQLETIVMGTPAADRKRAVGNFLGGGGGMGMLHSSTIGAGGGAAIGSLAGPVGAAVGGVAGGLGTAALGSFLKKSADAATLNSVDRLNQMTRSRSPLAANGPARIAGKASSPKQAMMARMIAGGFVPRSDTSQ
jgi:hypothetical protein